MLNYEMHHYCTIVKYWVPTLRQRLCERDSIKEAYRNMPYEKHRRSRKRRIQRSSPRALCISNKHEWIVEVDCLMILWGKGANYGRRSWWRDENDDGISSSGLCGIRFKFALNKFIHLSVEFVVKVGGGWMKIFIGTILPTYIRAVGRSWQKSIIRNWIVLSSHLEKAHGPFVCLVPGCRKVFAQWGGLYRHKTEVHAKKRGFQVHILDKHTWCP